LGYFSWIIFYPYKYLLNLRWLYDFSHFSLLFYCAIWCSFTHIKGYFCTYCLCSFMCYCSDYYIFADTMGLLYLHLYCYCWHNFNFACPAFDYSSIWLNSNFNFYDPKFGWYSHYLHNNFGCYLYRYCYMIFRASYISGTPNTRKRLVECCWHTFDCYSGSHIYCTIC
jgi:hypothetical protein